MHPRTALKSGFSLVQLSILLTVASLVLITILPTSKGKYDPARLTATRMDAVMTSFRTYMVMNGGVLPCPADGTLATGNSNYGVKAANAALANNCSGGSPAANYADSTNHVAIGMIPVKTLGLSPEYALDGWGRAITYAADTTVVGNDNTATPTCWTSPATGAITVTDNSVPYHSVIALVSHGANGHGAFIPVAGTGGTGTGVRLNTGSADTNEQLNAHVNSSFAATTTLTNFVKMAPTSTFDDIVVYSNPNFTMNKMPSNSVGPIISFTPPANKFYYAGQAITFTANYAAPVTVSGSPRIAISAINKGGITESLSGSGASANNGYAVASPGTGNSVNFTYTVNTTPFTDKAPNGFTITSPISLNGGSMNNSSGNPVCLNFTVPTLNQVIIPIVKVFTASGSWTVPADWNQYFNKIEALGSGGNGTSASGTAGGLGGGGGAYASIADYNSTLSSVTTVVGTAGGTNLTSFLNNGTTILAADYGRNANNTGTVPGAGGQTTNNIPANTGYNGGTGGTHTSTKAGGGGGGGAAGPLGSGQTGGNGANNRGGGGGGGGADIANPTFCYPACGTGGNGVTVGGAGGAGGNGTSGTGGQPGSLGGNTTGTNTLDGTAGSAGSGAGGSGSGGATAYNTGNGGAGALDNTTQSSWGAAYGPGGGGGASGGSNSGSSANGASSAGYGAGGGGGGYAPTTFGTAGSGTGGLLVITYR